MYEIEGTELSSLDPGGRCNAESAIMHRRYIQRHGTFIVRWDGLLKTGIHSWQLAAEISALPFPNANDEDEYDDYGRSFFHTESNDSVEFLSPDGGADWITIFNQAIVFCTWGPQV